MRQKHVEDYLEAIYKLILEKGQARISDISEALKIRPPSVTEMIQKLGKEGYIDYTPYKQIKLTRKGEEVARMVYRKHLTLKDFLKILGVEEGIAEEDACKIEHSLHPETVERLTKFVEFVQKAPKSPIWLEHFEYFYKTGKHPECVKES